jgi:hypothetical protein
MAIPQLTILTTDGSETTVTPNLFDTFGFEKMLKANPRLGTLRENTLKLQAFRAWSAGKREGTVKQTWEEFSGPDTNVLQVTETETETADEELETLGMGLDTPPAQ